jgi:beta-glucanase (GH16 family)
MILRMVSWSRRASIALVALASTTLASSCVQNTGLPEWTLVWEDNFDGAANSPPDPSRWRHDVGTDWGNAQLEYDTARTSNVSLDGNGHLVIVARKENYQGRAYTSARINTSGLVAVRRGRIEARMQMPTGQGLWPAFWLLGSNFSSIGWPACGEIDIMEYRGQQPNVVSGSLHGPGYSGGDALTGSYTAPQGRFDDGFHVFAIEWDTTSIAWLVDGSVYQRFTREDVPPNTQWVFDGSFFIILNVAVGGNYVGPPNAVTSFPQTMTVDYVRAYGLGS